MSAPRRAKSNDRVELVWPGKYDDEGRRAPLPSTGARLRVEELLRGDAVRLPGGARVEPRDSGDSGEAARTGNMLVCGDNLQTMEAWLERYEGAVDLVYIDPPFMTGNQFPVVTRVGEGEEDGRPAELRTLAYDDAWSDGLAGFLTMLDARLRMIRRLLAPRGSLYIHVDPTVGHAVKLLADEVFGPGCFQREIVWRIGWLSGFKTRARNWIRNHDLIFFYTRTPGEFTFNKSYVPYPEGYRRRDGSPPRGKGVPLEDVWNANSSEFELRGRASLDSIQIKSFSTEKTGWATQKNESLLRRIIEASSNPGDRVADVFCGSGTTLKVAHALGRRFLGCDQAQAAVDIACKRLLDGDAPASFELASLGAHEWRAPGLAAALVEAAGGSPRGDAPPGAVAIHGRAGEGDSIAIWVARLDCPVEQGVIAELDALARAAGCAQLRVIAREWAYSAGSARASEGALDRVELQVTRAALARNRGARAPVRSRSSGRREATRRDLGVRERPVARVEIAEAGDGLARARIVGYGYPHPELLEASVRDSVARWSDWLDRWGLERSPRPLALATVERPLTPRELRFRTHNKRTLELESDVFPLGEAPVWIRIETVDVIGARWRGVFRAWRDEAGALRARAVG